MPNRQMKLAECVDMLNTANKELRAELAHVTAQRDEAMRILRVSRPSYTSTSARDRWCARVDKLIAEVEAERKGARP